MPYKPKSEFVKELEMLGETPPDSWTLADVKCRIHELRQEQGLGEKSNKKLTQLKSLMIEMNKASRQKAQLVSFATQQLQIPLRNETIAQIQVLCIKKIYMMTEPAGEDPVGFGEHCSKTYQQLKEEAPRYAQWVMTTAKEEPEGDYRLRRLAHWLEQEKIMDTDKNKILPRKVAPADKSKITKGSAGSSGNMESNMEMMQQTIQKLQEELAALHEERPRKKQSAEEMSADSFSMVSQ